MHRFSSPQKLVSYSGIAAHGGASAHLDVSLTTTLSAEETGSVALGRIAHPAAIGLPRIVVRGTRSRSRAPRQ
ncbi:hypothetical protein [Microvirga ossetica]|uniref:hypothetical protein n=1 Tax=Microvirga ossetica TaxID=1882682 RepID=UPI001F2C42C0|nr:hypothetical protein [Microvirga ossetica]